MHIGQRPTPGPAVQKIFFSFPPCLGGEEAGIKLIDVLCILCTVLPTAFPIVTSLEPCNSRTCTVPETLPDNVTFECTVNSQVAPIWEIARSPYLSSQLPLRGSSIQILSGSNLLKNQGYLIRRTSQTSSTLDITQQARQVHASIQVRCIQFGESENIASDYYYVFTYGKPIIIQLHSSVV